MEADGARALSLAGLAAAAVVAAAAGGAASQSDDPSQGERLFRQCYACHSVTPEETGLAGPNLYGVVDRPMASDSQYRDYSATLRAAGAAGRSWSASELDRFIADPEAAMPGSAMGYVGMADPADRATLIAWLARRAPAR